MAERRIVSTNLTFEQLEEKVNNFGATNLNGIRNLSYSLKSEMVDWNNFFFPDHIEHVGCPPCVMAAVARLKSAFNDSDKRKKLIEQFSILSKSN